MAVPGRLARARKEPRLDPIRWRRPGAGTLIRLSVVAVLLSLAALIAWSDPQETGRAHSESPCLATPGPTGDSPDAASRSPTDARDPGSTAGDPASIAGDARDPARRAADGRGRALSVPPGSVGVPVRLADPTALSLIRPGDRVDVLRVDDAGHGTAPVAASALVLGVTGMDDPAAGGLLVALRPADAEKAVADQGRGFAILIRPE